MILDSGERRQFDTGAVRDIQTGKGRCDLMPLDVIYDVTHDSVIGLIGEQRYNKALIEFGHERGWDYPTMFLEVAKQFEDGAKKYGEFNWQKGIPVHCYIDSAVRHYLKWRRGDQDEPHDRAFVWNIVCLLWTLKNPQEDKKQ